MITLLSQVSNLLEWYKNPNLLSIDLDQFEGIYCLNEELVRVSNISEVSFAPFF